MFGFRYVKFQPSEYVLRYKKGKLVQQGAGLGFYYRLKTSAIAMLPTGSVDTPFIFEEITADYQVVTVQGQLVYRIADREKTVAMMDYTLKLPEIRYRSEDPKKLGARMVNIAKVHAKKRLERMELREAMRAGETLACGVLEDLRSSQEIASLGLDVLSLAVLSVLPVKETARALEAQTREEILKLADDAVYARRNASIEQERRVKENEYNTEISVENKKRQIRETQLDAEQAVQARTNALKEEQLAFDIRQEQQRSELVETATKNQRTEADVKAYAFAGMMKALQVVDPAVIQALASAEMGPSKLMAMAFQGLAGRAEQIGQLNITPDLLREILKS
jgi:hypothetical protein